MNAYFKKPRVEDTAYIKHLRNQPCVVTGYEFSEMGGPTVDPAHISHGNYARSMKASDWNIHPLHHDLHLKCDKNQPLFWQEAFNEDAFLCMDAVKALAQMRYLRWTMDTGRDVEAALREILA